MAKVVVVGGGVIGLCSAWFLAKAGYAVTVIDSAPEGNHGCSWGNAGMIVPSHFVPLAAPGMVQMGMKMMLDPKGALRFDLAGDRGLLGWSKQFMGFCTKEHVDRYAPLILDLNLKSRELYEQLSEEFGDAFGFRKSGVIQVCREEKTLDHESELIAVASEMGLSARQLSSAEVNELAGEAEVRSVGGVFFEEDAMLTPGLFLDALRERLKTVGVDFEFAETVTGWNKSGGRVIGAEIGDQVIEGDEFVVAGGVGSKDLLSTLGLDLPMMPGKGYSFSVGTPPQQLATPLLLVEARVAVTPMAHGIRFGGTMELGDWSSENRERRIEAIRGSVPGYMPGFAGAMNGELSDKWSGHRPCLPDGLPAIGRLGLWPNVSVATGHAMMGVSLGPITGKLVSELVTGTRTSVPVHSLSPERFA